MSALLDRIPPRFRHHEALGQFVRYAIVGVANVAVYFGVLNLLDVVGSHPNVSAAVAFFVTSIQSFTFNKLWAFRDRRREALVRQYLVFVFFTVIGLGINQLVFTLLLIPLDRFGRIGLNLAAMGALPFSVVWNFLSYRRWTFHHPGRVTA